MKILGLVSINIVADENHSASAKRIINFYKEMSKWHTIDILNVVPLQCNRDTLHINNNLTVFKTSLPHATICYYLSKYRVLPWIFVAKFHELFSFACSRYLQDNYDAYQIDNLTLYGLVRKRLDGNKIIYASHNVELDWYRPLIRNCLFSEAALRYLEKLEGELCRRASLITTISEQDKVRFSQLYNIDSTKILNIPMGCSPAQQNSLLPPRKEIKKKYHIPASDTIVLFCGSDFYANQEALIIMTKDIIPLLDNDITVVLVGNIGRYFKKLYPQGFHNTITLGFVENIQEIYSIADLAINPVMSGSGANVKTIDYLSAGLEILSTPFGMRGYDDMIDQVHICAVNEMAKKINRFAKNSFKKHNTGKVAGYQWSTIAAKANGEYEKMFNTADQNKNR